MQMQTATEYERAITAIMAAMSLDRKAQLYEYALFIQSRVVELAEEDAWMNASEADMQAEDALWASVQHRNPKLVQRMADAALESQKKGETTGIAISEGELVPTESKR